ncbi:MAG: InlB B-repeat-containing protein [Firmicutes bacterium]|nr:InlB B-repeat-containing protein [Bacillota bacterium]
MLDGKEYGQLPIPIKEGCTFLYWQTTQGETIQPNSIFYQKEDIVLTAKFIIETYSIVYDGNGGYNIPVNQEKVYNQDIVLSSNIPERYLYTFVEWNEEMDGTGRSYHPGQAYTLNSSLYLYAIWQRKEIDSITLNTQQVHLFVGDETQLEVQILPWKMVEHTILEWKSENENIISVDDGKIKALKEGETQVYVASHDGKQATCKVIVQDIPSRLEGYSLSLSGNIGVNFYMRLNEEITEDENAYMEFISPDGKIQKENVNQAKQDGIYHVFTCEVSAKDMTGDIQAKLINGKGEGIKEYHYSVEEYAKYLIEHVPTYEEHSIEIAKAMMTYGKYTQEYFGYKIDQVPKETNTLEDLDLSWAKYQYYTYGQEPSIEFVGARLLLTSRPSLKLYFLGEGTIRINNEVVSTEKEGNYTIVKISNITNMSEMFNIHSDSLYLQYGIYSYVGQAIHSDNESLIRLGKSLVAYNKSLFYV